MKMTMRKMLAILATLAILCAVLPLGSLFSAVAEGDNLVVNGGFENGEEGWQFNSGTHEIVSDAHTGNSAVKLSNPGAWTEAAIQTVAVEADSEYTLSWYSKRVSGNGAFNVFPMNTADWSNLKVEGQTWMNETSGNWVQNKVVVHTGTATAMLLKFSADVTNPGEILVDDITLTKKGGNAPVVPSDEPIFTENFDNGSAFASSSNIAVEDGALKFTVSADWGNVYTTLKTQAGTDYVVSFKAKAQVADKTLMIKFLKDDWATVVGRADVSVGTEWKEYSVTVNTADYTSPIFMFQYDGYAADGQVYWLDDVSVAPATGDQPDDPAVPTGDNLLVNGDFETGDATGWNTWQSTAIDAAAAKDGSYGAHLIGSGSWGGMLDQTVTVEAGKEYKLTFWINVVKTGINLQVLDGAGNKMNDACAWFDANTKDKQVEITFTAVDNGVKFNFCGSGTSAEEVYVDNFVLKALGGDQPDDPDEPDQPSAGLVNGGFESGDEGWTLSSSASVTTEDAYKGSASLKLENPSAWSEAATQKVAVKANTEYVIELYTKRVGAVKGAFNLFLMNADGFANLTIVEGQNWFNTNDTDWTKHTIVVNTGDATELLIKWSAEANNPGILLVDNMSLAEKGAEPEIPKNGLISNGGFETGDLTSWENLYGACNPEVNESSRYVGDYGLYFSAPGQWQQVRQNKIPVEPNTEYSLIVWAANAKDVQFIVKSGNDAADIASVSAEAGNEWKKYVVSFNSGEWDSVCVLLIASGENGGEALIDNVGLYKTGEEPDEPDQPDDPVLPPISLSLDSFGTILNRPASEDVNLIANGSFEKAEGGQWQELVGDTLYVVDDETAPDGEKSLYFNTSGVAEQTKLIFWLDVTPNTDYVFSAWLKGAFISDDNRYDATIGVVDPNGDFLTYDGEKFSNKNRQIVPPCWDNEWHLRSVTFNSGRAEQIGIAFSGKLSQLWIDSIALNTTNDAVRYADPAQFSYIGSLPSAKEYGGCADEDNLIPDANMDSEESVEFWSSAIGFENGFVTFPENEYEYGTSMKYTQSSAPGGVHAIKWIDVKPNTNYTFSVDIRVVKEGGGKLVLMDNKLREKEDFLMIDFDQFYYGVDWFNVTSEFNTGNFDRIGIAVVDGGGEALIDNMRLFESVNMIEGGVKDKYVEPPYSFDQPDSPQTGVSVLGIVLAVAVVPTSAAVALGLRRKKEDEE